MLDRQRTDALVLQFRQELATQQEDVKRRLDRLASTLSGGEAQRIQLATCLGSRLVGACYVLDEPSIGLHSRDTGRLIRILEELRELGNTIVVVEHDPDVMKSADHIVDLGPGAGRGLRHWETWPGISSPSKAGRGPENRRRSAVLPTG